MALSDSRTSITFDLDNWLVEEMDRRRMDLTRSQWLRRAIHAYVDPNDKNRIATVGDINRAVNEITDAICNAS